MAQKIMLQGTMSNVGKSLLTAALCRIFWQDGYRVAPFKSQNMALNSYVTAEGLEMGRAQVLQAEAAGVEPTVAMNPILLKPTTDVGSQVIVNGEVRGNMRAMEYFAYKKQLIPDILRAFHSLEEQYDIIVIEGAGSPAEMNLKKDDIVNMGLAEMVDAPVLLIGDIDRGGVFAQLIGTVQLLNPSERERVKGLIVNKFRGDRRLFEDGVRILEEKSGKPVIGVTPYIECDLDEEDSLGDKLAKRGVRPADVEIAVIRLPHISNYTDFDVFGQYSGVAVRYVIEPGELAGADLVILPGTKSTMGDLVWLRENGFEEAIRQQANAGTPIFGICGGYQMLGKIIKDPDGVEGGGSVQGIGLLDIETVFRPSKTRTRVTGCISEQIPVDGCFAGLAGKPFEGYEIHMGESRVSGRSFAVLENGKCAVETDGCCAGNIYGTYIHGLFDRYEISGEIVRTLYVRKNRTFTGSGINRSIYREQQLDRLAEAVRASLDMDLIYRILAQSD